MSTKLTPRQREALQQISRLAETGGVPPTIKELRLALDVSSDQSVLELLGRLEKKGYITRVAGSARGIFLTHEARLLLSGSPDSGTSAAGVTSVSKTWELTHRQISLCNKLSDIDHNLAGMYKGAIRVLQDPLNDDAIAQSAHSMRQVIDHLSRKADPPKEVLSKLSETRNTRGVPTKLRYALDPRGVEGLEKTVYDHFYDKFQVKLNAIAHHTKKVTKASYEEMLLELELFLLSYILPTQMETYEAIDQTLYGGPANSSPTHLFSIITKSVESYRYFFNKVDAEWLEFLNSNKFLRPAWEVCDYLTRTAELKPELTARILLSLDIPSDDWRSWGASISAASRLPGKLAASYTEKLLEKDFTAQPTNRLLAHLFKDLLDTLIRTEEFEAALHLADKLLEAESPVISEAVHRRRVHTALDDYDYSMVSKSLCAAPAKSVPPFIRLLVAKLGRVILFEHASGDGTDDLSSAWRPAIEDHAQNWNFGDIEESLVNAIRDLSEKAIHEAVENTSSIRLEAMIDKLLQHDPPYSIFDRIKLHLFRVFKEAFIGSIDKVLREKISDPHTWHEYARLIEEAFPLLPKAVQNEYLKLIDKAPGVKRREWLEEWRVRRLALVKDHLTPEQKKRNAALLERVAALETPDLLTTHHVGSVGPKSPITESDLALLSPEQIVGQVKTWVPKGGFFGASRSGFASVLGSVVAKEATSFSRESQRFSDETIHPVYTYHFLLGLEEGLKSGAELDWEAILRLGAGILDRARKGLLPEIKRTREEDIWETNWDGVFLQLARLVALGLDGRENGIASGFAARVWGLIEFLCEHPDPTTQYEAKYGGQNSDPFTLSLNTVRGQAFHALFLYIFWENRSSTTGRREQEHFIPEPAKQVLELHLSPTHDPSLTVRSVYGRFLPWLLSFGGKWAEQLVPLIFPDDANLRYAAWEIYLSNQLFGDVYRRLRPQYERALRDLRDGIPSRRYFSEPIQRLAEHAMIAYAYELEPPDNSFFEEFFRRSKGKQAGFAVSFGGRAYISRDAIARGERLPKRVVLERFWEWRLEESKSANELKEFGWWAKKDRFDNRWMLERLLETLKRTNGSVEGHTIVLTALRDLAGSHPRLSVEILELMVKCRTQKSYFLFAYSGEVKHILGEILRSENTTAQKLAHRLVDHMTKLGFEDFRQLYR